MKLNKKQVEKLDNIIEIIKACHADYVIDGGEGYYVDAKDNIVQYAEELVYELGLIDKKIFQ